MMALAATVTTSWTVLGSNVMLTFDVLATWSTMSETEAILNPGTSARSV